MLPRLESYHCVTIIRLDFKSIVNKNGPALPAAHKQWHSFMMSLQHPHEGNLAVETRSWGLLEGVDNALIILIAHYPNDDELCRYGPGLGGKIVKPDGNLAGIMDGLSPMLPFLEAAPQVVNLAMDSSRANIVARADHPVIDIFLLDVRVDARDYNPARAKWRDSPLEITRPVQHCYQSLVLRRDGCVGDASKGILRTVWVCHDLESYLKVPEEGELVGQALILEWKSKRSRAWFQHSSKWKRGFEDSFRIVQKEGKVLDIERWNVEIQPWPSGKVAAPLQGSRQDYKNVNVPLFDHIWWLLRFCKLR